MSWTRKLMEWKYPYLYELAPILDNLGLNPENYNTPFELAKDLRKLINSATKTIYVRGEWHPLAWYDPILDFFRWLWEQIMNIFGPYIPVIVLVGIGSLIIWLAPSYYKLIGVVPIIISIYLLLKELGVI